MHYRWMIIWVTASALTVGRAEPAPITPLNVADQSPPSFSVYTSRDGLSEEIWNTVAAGPQGFIWAGSASSLARFDGYAWTMQPVDNARSLVRDMATDAQGNLWAIFEREGMAGFDGRHWSLRDVGLGQLTRFSQVPDAAGKLQLWVGHDKGFAINHAGTWHSASASPDLPLGLADSATRTETLFGGPRHWMSPTSGGLFYREQSADGDFGAWQRFADSQFQQMPVTHLQRSTHNGREELWVLSYGAGLHRFDVDGIRSWRLASGELPTEAMYKAEVSYSQDGERLLWVASRAGLLRLRGDQISVYDRRHGLPSDAVRGLSLTRNADGTELLWLATEGGLARAALTQSQWQTVSLMGARENGIFALMLEPDGHGSERLWVGTAKQGLGLLQDGQWRYFRFDDGSLPAEGVRGVWLVPSPDGGDWRLLGLVGGQLLRIEDDLGLSPIEVPWPLQAEEAVANVMTRHYQGAREYWFGTLHSGIYRWRDGHWRQYADGMTLPWSVLKIVEQIDSNGRSWLWAASNQGLARFDGNRWVLLGADSGAAVDGYRGVQLIAEGERTVLWASSNRNGVLRLDVSDPSAPRRSVGEEIPEPPDPTVYSVLTDSQQRIYVCTNNGVQQLTPSPAGGFSERVFRRRDGMVHDECNTNAQMIDSHDRYWVGTLGGLSLFDPEIRAHAGATHPKPLYFTEFRVDGSKLDVTAQGTFSLPARSRELHLEFAVLSGLREAESTYRSRLLGYEESFSDWSSGRSRSFTSLPPGDYSFELEGRDYAGTPSSPQMLSFTVQPLWWQQRDRQALLGMLLALVGVGAVLLYNRNLRMRQRMLKRLVTERTADLRSANQMLTKLSYADPLTGVANRRRLIEAMEAAITRAARQRLPIGLIVIDVDRFKEYNDTYGHLAGDVALGAIAQSLQAVSRDQDLVARFGGEEFACLLIDAGPEIVAQVAERMRAEVADLPPHALGNARQSITLSAGWLSHVPAADETPTSLLSRADAALYQAKGAGRNCVRGVDEVQRPAPIAEGPES